MVQVAAARAELARREMSRRKLLPFVERRVRKYQAGWFHRDLCAILDQFVKDVEDGKEPRLIINCPPRHGKSTIATESFPPFVLGRHPDWDVIFATYNQEFADSFGRKIRDGLNDRHYLDLFKVGIDTKTNAADLVKTTMGGMFKATSAGGALTGLGAHVLIIDDPIKDRQQADSIIEREKLWDWYTSVARTRMHPGGGIIVIHTRWSTDDLTARLLKHANENPDADQWQVYEFPAIARENEKHRRKGEALHPERYPIKTLLKIKATLPARDWEALYQCRPYVESGNFFKAEHLLWYDDLPQNLNWLLAADYATSRMSANDRTAIIAVGMAHDGHLYIHPDIVYDRLDPLDAVRRTIQLGKQLKAYPLAHERGTIANLLDGLFRMEMERQKHWLVMERYTRTSQKQIHALAIKGRMEAGLVHFPRSQRKLIEPLLLRFMPDTDGEDDFPDALASAGIAIDRAVIKPPAPDLPSLPTAQPSLLVQQSNAFRMELQRLKQGEDQSDGADVAW